MTNLIPFQSEQFGEIRVVVRDDAPWWVAVDVCRALEIENPRDAISSLDDDEKITVGNPDGNPRFGIPHQLNIISESGLYSLIFRSKKSEAKTFRRWVTHEVLPSIRQTGNYLSEATRQQISDLTQQVSAFQRQITDLTPRLERLEKSQSYVQYAVASRPIPPPPYELDPSIDYKDRSNWFTPTKIGAILKMYPSKVGSLLKMAELHGDLDVNHLNSEPYLMREKSKYLSYKYNPTVILPVLTQLLKELS
jgi:prophage antirepressor-like protein